MIISSSSPWFLIFLICFIISSSVSFSYSQPSFQNIETFYPFPVLVPSPPPSSSISNTHRPSPPNSSLLFPRKTEFSPSSPALVQQNSLSDHTVAKAIAGTAVSTFVISTLLFFFVRRHVVARRKRNNANGGVKPGAAGNIDQFSRVDGRFQGIVISNDGLDVHYWRKVEEESKSNDSFQKVKIHDPEEEEDEDDDDDDDEDDLYQIFQAIHGSRKPEQPIQEIPFLPGKISASKRKVVPEISYPDRIIAHPANQPIEKPSLSSQTSNRPSPLPPPPPSPPPISLKKNNSAPPRTPPVPGKKINSTPPPPPPPPIPARRTNASSTLPKATGAADGTVAGTAGSAEDRTGNGNCPVKLKPLHWDKVTKITDHSTVWDKLGGGSFRFDDDLIEALFGCVANNKRSPKQECEASDSKINRISPLTQVSILDSRKSQNIAIVLKSLGVSRGELLHALTDGHGLHLETLEKLIRISPTKEEESQILEFRGDINKLPDAESFLYHTLKAVPSAFTRISAMLFRSNYNSEILQYKESLHTFELASKELRTRGLFVKILEAVLKAGNRMNAGTSRGNAQAFSLNSLQKLSDVKSTDGKTTLLHFIIDQVVRSEGKRCVVNRNHSLERTGSKSSILSSENLEPKDDMEKEYVILGLPIVGGLSSEYSNLKKAAQIDYDSFAKTGRNLAACLAEVRVITSRCKADEEEGFGREMKSFLQAAEEELQGLREEEGKIMELVRKTTEYYQPEDSRNKAGGHPLELFVTIKDFLGMVDRVCVEIARNLQKRKRLSSNLGSSPKSAGSLTAVKFPSLSERFMKEKSSSSSSESESEF